VPLVPTKYKLQKTIYKNKNKSKKQNVTTILSDFKFNNNTIMYNYKIKNFVSKNFFGMNNHLVSLLEERLEVNKHIQLSKYSIDKWLSLSFCLNNLVPTNKTVKEKLILNLNHLFLIRSYRGWRHTFNLPTRGQRTWSNAASNNKTKNVLRDYKFNCFKTGLANSSPEDVKNAFYLEQLNALWKWQWEKEWALAFKKRQTLLKKTRGLKKLDLSSLARVNPNFTKSKKQVLIPFGFESGFTKNHLKNSKSVIRKKKIKLNFHNTNYFKK